MPMRELLEEKLARFEELEKQLVDPEVLSNPARDCGRRARARLAGQAGQEVSPLQGAQRADRRSPADDRRATTPRCANWPRPNCPSLRDERETLWNELLDMTIGGEDANRSRVIMEIRAGTGGDEAALFARDLYEMYKHHAESKGWKVEVLDHQRHRAGRLQGNHPGRRGRRRLPRAAIRERRPPRAARARNRNQGPHPHLGRHRGRAARAGRRRNRPQARRLSQGHVLRQRPRRAARQQDRLGRPADALRDRHRRAVPGRKEPAQELRQGAARAQDAGSTKPSAGGSTTSGPASARRWSARATAASAFAPTTSPRTA